MRNPRIYVDAALSVGGELALPSAQTRHLSQVLRLGTGDTLTLFNGNGRDYAARLLASSRQTSRVHIESEGEPEPTPPMDIHLVIGISKGERMDFALQKAVELGAERLTPVFTKRSQVKLDGARLDKRLEHWRGVVVSACEQSGRRRLPALEAAEPLETWLEGRSGGGLLLDPTAPLTLPELSAPEHGVILLIGPEGGLAPEERTLAARHGFQGVRLGPRILRTETAPLAAIAVIQALWGDFRGI